MSFPGRVMIEAPYAKLPPGLPLMVPPPRLGGVLSSMFAGESVPIGSASVVKGPPPALGRWTVVPVTAGVYGRAGRT